MQFSRKQWSVPAVLSLIVAAGLIAGTAGMQAMLISQAGPSFGRMTMRLAQAAPVETFAFPVSKNVFSIKRLPRDCEALLDLEDSLLDPMDQLYDFVDMLEGKLERSGGSAQRASIERTMDEADALIDRGWDVLDSIDRNISAVCVWEEE